MNPAGTGIKRGNIRKTINKLATKNKNKNVRDLYRGMNEFKRGYQPRSYLVMGENGDLLSDSHSILNRNNRKGTTTVSNSGK
jgi:hypothetical protein